MGEGNTGIVMSGVFDSNPYEAGDWSGKGRHTFYMDMTPNVVLDPERAPMVTKEELQKAIPSFDWTGGHSGRMQIRWRLFGKSISLSMAITLLGKQ